MGPDGRIAARLANYEHRPQQLEMAEAVARAIAAKQHLVAEAGTGVGKSFAYLVPAILAATEPQAHVAESLRDSDSAVSERLPHVAAPKIVISTHTISLQEQLIGKDLPLLNAVIPREFSAVLVKGRRNYLSLRRLDLGPGPQPKPVQRRRAARAAPRNPQVEQDRRTTARSAISRSGRSARCGTKWPATAATAWAAAARRTTKCFYYKDRRRVQHAQILVVNHALLFSDLALRRAGVSILPDYDVVILDEAHTVEAVAGDHLGINVTSGQIEYVLNKLYNDRTNKGLLVHHGLAQGAAAGRPLPPPGRRVLRRPVRLARPQPRAPPNGRVQRAGHRRQPPQPRA